MRLLPSSFRTRILLVALAGVVPLAGAGLWLTGSAARSGEELLRNRLSVALDEATRELGLNWVRLRSQLLDLAETGGVRAALNPLPTGASGDGTEGAAPETSEVRVPAGVERVTILDGDGAVRWAASPRASDPDGQVGPLLPVTLPLFDAMGRPQGELRADIRLLELLRSGALPSYAGITFGVYEPRSDAWLVPLPWYPAGTARRVTWGGEDWVLEHSGIPEPLLLLAAASPVTPFTRPFEAAARRGAWILLVVLALGTALAFMLAGQLTRSLERLATAADAVGRGDLDTRVEEAGADEVGRVARAFNAMTAGLRRALGELAHRESLAAVGEFAASLAHEVRNPLTSVKVDLQLVEEALPHDSPLREVQRGAVQEIDRLDRTVAGVLRIAGSGKTERRSLDLAGVLASAAHAAEPTLEARRAKLRIDAEGPIPAAGDPDALHQVFLNLLLNAAQALEDGGEVALRAHADGGQAVVEIRDTGSGMEPDVAARVFEPFFTTRPEGSGLGLAVAQRVVAAHRGRISLESHPGRGTVVTVHLPCSGE